MEKVENKPYEEHLNTQVVGQVMIDGRICGIIPLNAVSVSVCSWPDCEYLYDLRKDDYQLTLDDETAEVGYWTNACFPPFVYVDESVVLPQNHFSALFLEALVSSKIRENEIASLMSQGEGEQPVALCWVNSDPLSVGLLVPRGLVQEKIVGFADDGVLAFLEKKGYQVDSLRGEVMVGVSFTSTADHEVEVYKNQLIPNAQVDEPLATALFLPVLREIGHPVRVEVDPCPR